MNNPADDAEFRSRVQELETLLAEIESTADPAVRSRMTQVVQTLMEFHGAGLSAMMDHIAQAGSDGAALLQKMAADDLVSSLLLLYNLHPSDLGTRVKYAVDRIRPTLTKHSFEVDLLGVDHGIARVRLTSAGHGCQSTAANMKRTVEQAIYDRAPDIAAIEISGLEPAAGPAGFVPIEQLMNHNGRRKPNFGDAYESGTPAQANAR